ncbi:SRPBCC domain-containing protein [Actinopolyspora sp. H202]|uniref:SRPBCC family protein n=1 Tax=Actinopolyspora sp. H202 TaxID=1500456 RepID=UPI003EE5D703
MRLEHEFTVPVPADVAWPVLLDPEQVAPCMPGATLKSAEGEEFAGSVKVKLGPVSLMYKGNGSFTEVDHEERRAVIEASGKDSRGNGTASASVTARLAPEGTSTRVHVDTDLKVTGKPAQLGRGLISDVAQKLIDQFAECLAGRLTGSESEAGTGREAVTGQETSPGTSTAAGHPETPREQGAGQSGASTSAAPAGNGSGPAVSNGGERTPATPASGASAGETSDGASTPADTGPGWKVTEAESGESSRSSARLSTVRSGGTGPTSTSDDAVDLLGTAGMPVLKRVAPVLAGLAALTVLFVLLRRRARRAG